jgi:1-acyl-sn-glycerol-3-phosphate acyltransferase
VVAHPFDTHNLQSCAKLVKMKSIMSFPQVCSQICRLAIALFARFTPCRLARIEPINKQRVYFANHVSNADMPMICPVCHSNICRDVRPVGRRGLLAENKLRASSGQIASW